MDACLDACMDACMDACTDACMDTRMDACMDARMDAWMHAQPCYAFCPSANMRMHRDWYKCSGSAEFKYVLLEIAPMLWLMMHTCNEHG